MSTYDDDSADDLDHSPLTFGKYRGQTPDEISELGKDGMNYIRWMFETVENKPTCSRLLYEACGGKPLKPVAPIPKQDSGGLNSKDDEEWDDDIPF